MKVLITGGAGFIGSHLADAYLQRGDRVVLVDDLSSGSKNNIKNALEKGAEFFQLKVQSPELRKLIADQKPDLINHHAAQKSVRDSVDNPMKDADINLIGILNVLEGARQAGVQKVLFASSGGVVYGEQDSFPASESHSKRPLSPYGVAKYSSELYLDFYGLQWGLRSVALRYANIYGPRQDPFGEAGVVAIFCKRMLQNAETVIYGTGLQTRDFVYVSDVVAANLAAEKILNSGAGGFKAFNIGTAREASVKEIQQKVADGAGYQKPPKFEPAKSGEQMRSSLSFEAFQGATGWKPQMSLEQGLRSTYEWFKAQA